uniref:Bystin putative n=1 Tax=Albugo laibachii Nc14 TaxID=890382 RepID=F0WZ21_9STRA|nr:bystin putative [Albugo laibachii Nc14]|eukprot:CCA26736.1 bystin putative [Albugo laibachii Nc14]
MPKAPRIGKSKRSCPLEKQLAYDQKPWYEKTHNVVKDEMDAESEEEPDQVTEKTIRLAREQQREEKNRARNPNVTVGKSSHAAESSEDESDDEDMKGVDSEEDDLIRVEDGYVQEVELFEEDESVLASFMMPSASERRNLADIIMEKIQQKEAGEGERTSNTVEQQFDPKIVEVYTGVGKILHRYTSGKLPKAFKVIPSLSYWEDILWLTEPSKWSPHSMYATTRIFASNLNPKMAERFYNIFLLEHVRQDIRDNKRLNFHLYMALKKALYKPQAFFKGIMLPLCESQDCTLREATIIGSVMTKVSVPVIHSAAALMKLARLPYSGPSSIFILLLLNKKYSLPTRVIAELCQHFISFTNEERELPVLWHQALLVFAQRYKNGIGKAEKEKIKILLLKHSHHQITPEIRRELFNADQV